jgi:hypothetical protein
MPLPFKTIKPKNDENGNYLDQKVDDLKHDLKHEKINPKDILLGDNFLTRWLDESESISPNNRIPAEILCYSVVGHIFKDFKFPHIQQMGGIDNRVHFLWAQPQRSGKSRLFSEMIEPLCELAGIGVKLQGIMSGAGAVGGSDSSSKGDLEIHFDKIHFFDEFMASIHSLKSRNSSPDELLDVLRMAMNSDGRVSKRLSSVSHNYVTRATLVMTTTLIDLMDLPKQAIRGGFLGRPLCLFRDISENEKKKMENDFCKYARTIDSDLKYEFTKTLLYFEKLVQDRKVIVGVTDDWRDVLADEMEKIPSGGSYYNSLREGSLSKIIKIATVRAILYETSITEQIKDARKIEQDLLKISGTWMDLSHGDADESMTLLVSVLKDGGLTKREIKRRNSIFRNDSELLDKTLTHGLHEGIIRCIQINRAKRYELKDSSEYDEPSGSNEEIEP